MNMQGVMFGIVCLVVGLVIGFVAANSINKSGAQSTPAPPTQAGPLNPQSGNPALPADHPPLGTSSGDANPTGGPLPEVMKAIEKAKEQPNDYDAQMTAADLYYQIQKFDDAAKLYETANKLKPTEIEPMVKAGNAHFDAEQYEQAEKWYTQALAKKPDDINVRTDLGLTFYLRTPRDIDRAIKEYRASLAINPEHEITLQNLALAYKEKGDTTEFQKTFNKLKSINPNNPVVTKGN